MDGCGSGNLVSDCDLLEEREVLTNKQGSISQSWISNKGRGVCTLYSPSSQHVSTMEFHFHPPGSPSQKPRSLPASHTSPPPCTTTDQTARDSGLSFSGPHHPPTPPSPTSDGPLPSVGPCRKTYPLLPAPCLPQSRSAVWVVGPQPFSAREALLDLGLHPPAPPRHTSLPSSRA